jgi:small-conductance mechanosensitive channel
MPKAIPRPRDLSSSLVHFFTSSLLYVFTSFASKSKMPIIDFIAHNWRALLWSAVILCAAIAIALVVHLIVFKLLERRALRKPGIVDQSLIKHGKGPARWIFPLLAVLAVLPGLPLPPILMSALEHITGLGLIAAIAWMVLLFIEITSDVLAGRYRMDVEDNLVARRIQTQFQMLHRILIVLVSIVTLSIMLMTFPVIKHIGMSLLASAGLATLVVGMAMQGTLSNVIAGVQIAFAQPFRLEDAVVVEGEWGWIEEIGTMYVVVRIWDLRRLVLPLSYFLTHPFQNWTRTSAQILGNTILYADYTVPMDALRAELRRICESTKLWRGQVCILQISDATEHTVQLRALMDARNSSDAWDLRCLVREGLIDFLQKNYPQSLPRYRGEFSETASPQPIKSVAQVEHSDVVADPGLVPSVPTSENQGLKTA